MLETRTQRHVKLVDAFYFKITGMHCPLHDRDKIDSYFWNNYYNAKDTMLLTPRMLNEWLIEDKKHRYTSSHHIECLLEDYSVFFDWEELVADFYAVNLKHHRSPRGMLKVVKRDYAYALPEIRKYIDIYKDVYKKGR